jgi:hypothetical protein
VSTRPAQGSDARRRRRPEWHETRPRRLTPCGRSTSEGARGRRLAASAGAHGRSTPNRTFAPSRRAPLG